MPASRIAARLSFSLVALLAHAALLLVPAVVLAATPERQLLVVQDSDYSGRDYDVLKEVELDACKSACLADSRCLAFTYNTKARWCFLKDRYEDLRTFVGAVAGRVLEGDAATLGDRRRAELGFLPAETLTAADALTQGIGALGAPDQLRLRELTKQARSARGQGNGERSVALYAAAVRLAPDDSALWLGLAQSALAAKPDAYQLRETRRSQSVAAAVNAYLSARGEDGRVRSLAVLGRTLAGRQQWRPAIAALGAALALKDDPALGAELRKLKEQHGFRITGHRVELDSATPRICIELSESLARTRPNLADFVRVEGGGGLEVEAGERQICVDGVSHGARYPIQVRAGLPAANGDTLEQTVDLDIKVGDRTPSVRFSGRAYVLPRGGEAALPVVSVNADRITAVLYRIGDRSIAQVLGDGPFLKQLGSYQAEQIADQSGERLWSGTIEVAGEVGSRLNREVTTAIPLGDLIRDFEPGVYAVTATPSRTLAAGAAQGCDGCSTAPATQWFVVSDLGLTALTGNDGLHALVRSLSGAAPLVRVRLRLIARNNEVLGSAVTDAAGYARFEPGLLRGSGGNAPLLLTAETDGGDYGFLDLAGSPFDLSDRGVTGRPAPKPLDVFLVAERGAYRPGETVHLSALVRDARAEAVAGIPLTLIVKRPDGVERERLLVQDEGLGGYQADLNLTSAAMRGTWRVQAFADPKGDPLAQASFLVEDFEPERLDFTLKTGVAALDPAKPAPVAVDARFLYGAPGARLAVEGETLVEAADSLAAFPGYRFGLENDEPEVARQPLTPVTTDDQGRAQLEAQLPELVPTSRPLRAEIQVRVADPGGRAVERTLDIPVWDGASRIGVRPLFEGEVEEGGTAGFEVLALGPDGARRGASGLAWTLYRVDTQFQWYRGEDGTFDYEPVERTRRVASGRLDLEADRPGRIETPVEWGGYRLQIEGDGLLPVSLGFEAGWYVAPRAADTPDQLRLTLDKATYRVGERVRVHIEPRAAAGAAADAGSAADIALLMILDDRLIAMQAVEVPPGGTTLELPVTADWGPGAYVTAALYRPMDRDAKRMPSRALGLAWAEVDPGARRLQVRLETAQVTRPRGPMQVRLRVPGLTPGEEAYAILAAVDLGILNLTGYQAPEPDAWYFGQRRLGIEIRDLYGQLIDPMQGAPGVVRSGGDGGLARLQAPPPTEELMAWFSGVVRLDDQGEAVLELPVPSFNGTVRLMAMAWTAKGVGHGTADALIRDPVVLTVGMPRFLAPGDRSRVLLALTQVEGEGGPTRVTVSAAQGLVALDPARASQEVSLIPGARTTVLIPMEARAVGDESLSVRIDTAEGQTLTRPLTLGVRDNAPFSSTTTPHTLATGAAALMLTPDLLHGLVPGTANLLVSVSRAGRLDLTGLLRALDRYPHGCTEQLVSRALPLLYVDQVALAVGLAGDPAVKPRVQDAITRVLANQSGDGQFGVWGPGGDDPWLDAFATDFLTRARERGYAVSDPAFDAALTNLQNRAAYTSPGEADAYALYVLARNGRASIGDLRYLADERLSDLGSPMAKAQVGAALALYGDPTRADAALEAAATDLAASGKTGWRADYGTPLRDAAAVLALAAEAGSQRVDLRALTGRVQDALGGQPYRSTQENTWLLLAAGALTGGGADGRGGLHLEVDGAPVEGSYYGAFDGARLAAVPVAIRNLAGEPVDAMVTSTGVRLEAPPAGGDGYMIERAYYDLDGRRMDLSGVPQGQRLVAVVTVRADQKRQARLIVDDPLPAGFEIDNPNLLASGDLAQVPGLSLLDATAHREFRTDRFVAAVDRDASDPQVFQLGYLLRAVSPGVFAQPPASVEDMYDSARRAWTGAGSVTVLGPVQ